MKKVEWIGRTLLTRLNHEVLLELNRKIPIQLNMNREITVPFQKHFMMQPCDGAFSLFIQLFARVNVQYDNYFTLLQLFAK